jgi:hypothetical protein
VHVVMCLQLCTWFCVHVCVFVCSCVCVYACAHGWAMPTRSDAEASMQARGVAVLALGKVGGDGEAQSLRQPQAAAA